MNMNMDLLEYCHVGLNYRNGRNATHWWHSMWWWRTIPTTSHSWYRWCG
ncbi:unnamed protein product [Brassica rapa subsp. narinosa]